MKNKLTLLAFLALAAPATGQDLPFGTGTVRTVTPRRMPAAAAYLVVDVQPNVAFVAKLRPQTVVTVNGQRVPWRFLRAGDVVTVWVLPYTLGGWAVRVAAVR
jgi:hypothetical protein